MKKKNDIIRTAIGLGGVIAVVGLIAGVLYFRGGASSGSSAAGKLGGSKPDNVPESVFADLMNKPSPAFSLSDRSGFVYTPENLRGKKVVLFFTEGIMCYPACWDQIAALGKDKRFDTDEVTALSIVMDSQSDWEKAVKKMPELASAKIVFDKNGVVSRSFGMLTVESSMHYGAYPGHTYVIMDKEGIIRYIFDDPAMGIRNDQIAGEIKKLD